MNKIDVDSAFEEGFRSGKPTMEDAAAVKARAQDIDDDAVRSTLKNNYRYTSSEWKAKNPEGDYLEKNRFDAPNYTVSPFIQIHPKRAQAPSKETKIFSFSNKELKEMDRIKGELQEDYEEKFSHFNRGKPLTQRQIDHAEDAAVMAAAQQMMETQAKDRGDNYGVGADMSDAGDAAEQALQDNRPSRRAEPIQRKRPAP